MTEAGKRPRQTIQAPYGRVIRLDEVDFESGMRLLRVTIREGGRFTILDLDAPTAAQWGRAMSDWAQGENPHPTPGVG
ncbi:MAG TPA: hypothetical protein VEF36_12590 [Roseiarcus sp.]|nr:hypothetical protein [Roseiarcus sp.]